MDTHAKINEQLLKEIEHLKIEIGEMKIAEIEFKRVKEALRIEHELYLDLASAHPAGIYRIRVFSTRGLSEEMWLNTKKAPLVIEFCNDRFCAILNVHRSETKVNPGIVQELVFEADKAEFAKINVVANQTLTPFEWEGRFRIKGEIKWCYMQSLPRPMKNGDIIWTGIILDITARKKVEHKMRLQNGKLQKLNAEKDKFFSIIAHDMNAPLNAIAGFSELLAEQIIKKDIAGIEEYSDIIRKSSLKAKDLLRNLMEWSLSKTGRMNFNPEVFDIVEITDEILSFFAYIASQKSIIITREVQSSSMLVSADRAMIGTIIRNLVSNAIKFTKPGGRINISTALKQGDVMFMICDNGVGIPNAGIEKLFRIDQNYSTPGTHKEQGTGLGLILCKEFIEKHNGKIGVQSEVGTGSTFYFTLPSIVIHKNKLESQL